jgi:hypothetical protein
LDSTVRVDIEAVAVNLNKAVVNYDVAFNQTKVNLKCLGVAR